jgi:hypothetical protein
MLPQQQQIRIQSRAPIDAIDQEMTAPTESEPNCCSKSAAEKKQKTLQKKRGSSVEGPHLSCAPDKQIQWNSRNMHPDKALSFVCLKRQFVVLSRRLAA